MRPLQRHYQHEWLADYARHLLFVAYGLRGNEVAKLTLDNIDWNGERLSIPERNAGHWSAYPMAAVVGDANIDYLKNRRHEITVRHVFLRTMAPRSLGHTDPASTSV